jgi:hypothetical protein
LWSCEEGMGRIFFPSVNTRTEASSP